MEIDAHDVHGAKLSLKTFAAKLVDPQPVTPGATVATISDLYDSPVNRRDLVGSSPGTVKLVVEGLGQYGEVLVEVVPDSISIELINPRPK
jgi:hypothetical protein